MTVPFLIDKRRVIPNWRPFKTMLSMGELDPSQDRKDDREFEFELLKIKMLAWHQNKDFVTAIELINSAVVLGFKGMAEVIEAAEFIKENPSRTSISLLALANDLTKKITKENTPELEVFDWVEDLEELTNKAKVNRKIAVLKEKVRQFPQNPILWVELARHYSIIGVPDKAKRSMRIAYGLASENRFVLRSYSRLFVHLGEYDVAHDALRRSSLINSDPWIISAEIAVASLRERQSKFIKKGSLIVASDKFTPRSITELSSSLATLELENGSIKKSRELFYKSLLSPNDNSLAQIEWATQEEKKLQIFIPKKLFHSSYEALTYDCFNRNDWNGVITNSLKWFIETPIAKTAMVMGHHVSSIFLRDYDLSMKFCLAALVSHPSDPGMLNNLAYSLACLNRTVEAQIELKKAEASPNKTVLDAICIKATKGLIHFRKKELQEARRAYLEAISEAKKISEQYYYKLALLHFTREEVLISSPEADILVNQVNKLTIDPENKDLLFLKNEVLRLRYKKTINAGYPSQD